MKEKPHPDMSFEMEARASGFLCVAGGDEAGRGPLAGPVVAGAVILPVLHTLGNLPILAAEFHFPDLS